MEGLGGPSATLGNLVYLISLVLKMSGLGVPPINSCEDGVKGHDLLHKWGRDSSNKETDKDIVVCDASIGDVTLDSQDVTFK